MLAKANGDLVLQVKDLRTHFTTRAGVTKAVDGVSFDLRQGETLGIVGESACGKTITALSLLRLVPRPAGQIVGGQIMFKGEDLLQMDDREMRQIRGRHISMILQDPQASLNPVFTVGSQIMEAAQLHHSDEGKDGLRHRVQEALRMVQISDAVRRVAQYPHQMSGGIKQRIVGAMMITCQPEILIADEPTTSLDVTIQAQYLRLLRDIQAETGLSIIFITHDFGVVARMCDRVAVMYAGRIVETGDVRRIFHHPSHPYTQALIASVPKMGKVERLASIEGQPPSLMDLGPGCAFAKRCTAVHDRCWEEAPPSFTMADGHHAACWKLEAS